MTRVGASAPIKADSDSLTGSFTSRTSRNGAIRLHWLDSGAGDVSDTSSRLPALVFVPGFGEEAKDHSAWLAPVASAKGARRRVVIPDLRGRGGSDRPTTGYTLEDHVSDLSAVMESVESDVVHVAAYSRGTAYAIAWALSHRERVASLTIGDYPAEHIVPPAGAAEFLAGRKRFGRPMTERMPRAVMERVFAACRSESFYAPIAASGIPVLLVRGALAGTMITPEVLSTYRAEVDTLEVETFEDSGHDLWRPDAGHFGRAVARFVAKHDP